MNRAVIFSLIVGLAGSINVQAYESHYPPADLGAEQWQGGRHSEDQRASSYSEEWQGAGMGGLAGALLAGPPGFIIGAAGGVLAGRNAGMESDLHTTRQEVARLEQQQQQTSAALNELTTQLTAEQSQQRQQLQAIASGFLYRVQFRTNQSRLETQDQLAIKDLAKALGTLQSLKIHIHAFADKRGQSQENLSLTEARAQTVAQQLMRWGVSGRRIKTRAYGEASARYDQPDVEGLGFDRQVIIRFCLKEAT